MKKIYTTLLLSMITLFVFAQSSRKASLSDFNFPGCKTCLPNTNVVKDTICNLESDDTLSVYYSDNKAPRDSGWAIGQNAYFDKGWAEKHTVTGSANVIGGAYYFYEKTKSNSSTLSGTGNVRNTSGTGGKPGATTLGSKSIPFNTMNVSQTAPYFTYFTFATPVAVTGSFFMTFELPAYTSLAGPDTVGIVTTRHNNRSTSNADQNCAMDATGAWNFELTENFKLKINYMLCAIIDIAGGVNNYATNNGLSLYAAYPSPAGNFVTIDYAIDNASEVSIEIFDAQGKSVLNMAKETLAAGKHSVKVDVSSFAAGSYFYNVATENGVLFSRFSVAK